MPFDFKRADKNLYMPGTIPSIINVPEMMYISVSGRGDPNSSQEYAEAVELLYGLSYSIKMNNKAILEYVVPPLEGFWSVDDDFKGGGAAINDKSKFIWTMVIRQPDFVSTEIFMAAKASLAKKKKDVDTTKAELSTISEGLCVQVMHIGSYDDEPATVEALDKFANERGYLIDINDERRHHEIYISDPRKVEPNRLKTVLRHPIREGIIK